MRNISAYNMVLLLFFTMACKEISSVPIWKNKADRLVFQNLELVIECASELERAILYTPFKSLPLDIHQKSTTISHLSLPEKSGIVEGSSILFLKTKNLETIFEFELVNDTMGLVQKKDYRSPKTVNPDSVLAHQQIVHFIDKYRNLVVNDQHQYFQEQMLRVSAKSGQYEGIPSEPLSYYYSQPGTASKLPLKVQQKDDKTIVQIGPILDKVNNKVADGTLIHVRYKKDSFAYIIPIVSKAGMASTTIEGTKEISEIAAETAKVKSKKY